MRDNAVMHPKHSKQVENGYPKVGSKNILQGSP